MIDPPGLPAIRRADPEFLLGGCCDHAGAGSEFKIQDAKFKIQKDLQSFGGVWAAACEGGAGAILWNADSGLSLQGRVGRCALPVHDQNKERILFRAVCGQQLAKGSQERFCGMR